MAHSASNRTDPRDQADGQRGDHSSSDSPPGALGELPKPPEKMSPLQRRLRPFKQRPGAFADLVDDALWSADEVGYIYRALDALEGVDLTEYSRCRAEFDEVGRTFLREVADDLGDSERPFPVDAVAAGRFAAEVDDPRLRPREGVHSGARRRRRAGLARTAPY